METLIAKVMVLLAMSMGLGAVGAYCGRYIRSPGALIGVLVAFVLGCFGVFFAAHLSPVAGVLALAAWTFVSGLAIGPSIEFYSKELGWQTVAGAFAGTSGVMALCGGIGLFSGADFSSMGTYLGFALFGLIIVGVVGIFVRLSREMNLIYAGFGMVIFAGYFIFDFFRLGHTENTWEKAIQLTMSIYLDFINFFLYLLQFLAALQDKHH